MKVGRKWVHTDAHGVPLRDGFYLGRGDIYYVEFAGEELKISCRGEILGENISLWTLTTFLKPLQRPRDDAYNILYKLEELGLCKKNH